MKTLTTRLGSQAKDVQVLFVTVDPDRDTLEKLNQYMSAFNPAFYGLTGTTNELESVWKAYGVYREIRTGATAAGYLVDHTARLYCVDKQGRLRVTYSFGTPVDAILSDVRYLLKE
jgi:protein SCO1/2